MTAATVNKIRRPYNKITFRLNKIISAYNKIDVRVKKVHRGLPERARRPPRG